MSNELRIQLDFYDREGNNEAIVIPPAVIRAIGSPQHVQLLCDRKEQVFFIADPLPDIPRLPRSWGDPQEEPISTLAESYDSDTGCYRIRNRSFMAFLREYISHAEVKCIFSVEGEHVTEKMVAFEVKKVKPDVDATIARIASEESRKKRRAKQPFRLDEYVFMPELKSRLSIGGHGN